MELCKSLSRRWDKYMPPTLWLHRTTPDLECQARPPTSAYYSAKTAVPRWTLPRQAPTTRAWTDCVTLLPTRVTTLVKRRKFARTYSTAMSRDASDESTATQQRRLRREHHNAGIKPTSTGTRVKQVDLVLVKKADSALHNDCVHVNRPMIDGQNRGPSQQ